MQNSKRAIIKFINYETPDSIAKAQKTRDYICSDKRTSPEYIFTHALYADNVPESLATIEEKWHPGGH